MSATAYHVPICRAVQAFENDGKLRKITAIVEELSLISKKLNKYLSVEDESSDIMVDGGSRKRKKIVNCG